MNAEEIIQTVVEVCRGKKAKDMIALDLRGLSTLADFFFLCSAENTRQVNAVVEETAARLKKAGRRLLRTEGLPEARWVVMDYGSVLVHVFLDEVREHYSLETLWGDAPRKEYGHAAGD
ncbi:MAG: ribosome silencing factor [PVC group bacterium]